MTSSTQKLPGFGGGSVATRGLLVQTLVALLELVHADPPVAEITLEPALGDEQFDFIWKDSLGIHATQVKSTSNSFTKADVKKWAIALQKARRNEHCKLMLVGNIPPSLVSVHAVGAVRIETMNLHFGDLVEQAAQRLAKFLEREGLQPGTAEDRETVVCALTTRLQHLAVTSQPLARATFIELLAQWVKEMPRGRRPIDISRLMDYAPAELIGRETETKLLCDAWEAAVRGDKGRPHVLTIVAIGGEGKTSLVSKWLARLAHQDWPGCDAVLAWSFHSQGAREQRVTSSDSFFQHALAFFGDAGTGSATQSGPEKGRRLAQLVGEQRALLILDGLEPLQYGPMSPMRGVIRDSAMVALLSDLAAGSRGLCMITSRQSIANLRAFGQSTALEVNLGRLSTEAGVALLKKLGVNIGPQRDFERLVEDVKGHALTLHLLGIWLRDVHAGDVRMRDRVNLEEADAEEQDGRAFRVMDEYVHSLEGDAPKTGGRRALSILRTMGLFDRPATAECLYSLWDGPVILGLTDSFAKLSEERRNLSIARLAETGLLVIRRDASGALLSLDAHPLLREYFARQLHRANPQAWREAHKRLYDHLVSTTNEGELPTLEDLQPLYQAVAHGCHAGLHKEACKEVYFNRIQRGREFYSTFYLGASGSNLEAVTCFFDRPWTRVADTIDPSTQSWLLNEAGYSLRSVGRLIEALVPLQLSGELSVNLKEWASAAASYGNLSELELALGAMAATVLNGVSVAGALRDAEQGVSCADRSGDAVQRITKRTALASALHAGGQLVAARKRFREAEDIQRAFQPHCPLLYSVHGFQYCELLLVQAERAAWQACLGLEVRGQRAELVRICREIEQRVITIFRWRRAPGWDFEGDSLLDVANDHLTLGRTALIRMLLEQAGVCRLESECNHIDVAVDFFYRAAAQHHSPRGFLARAWRRATVGDAGGASRDLDEAWGIARCGPMPLFMADVHLSRARLFGQRSSACEPREYPWGSPDADLAEARQLIKKHGYRLREEELADATAALGLAL